mgnify:CR=1 FL=1
MPDNFWIEFPKYFFAATFFITGSMIGSFLNVCIHRMPLEQSLVHPPSHCPKCKYSIPWHLNIPVFAWIRLGGRCGNCAEPINIRYPLVELLTGVAFLAAWICTQPDALHAVALCLLLAGFITATFIDFDHQIIPDEITIGGMVLGVMFSAAAPQIHASNTLKDPSRLDALQASAIGLGIGFGLVYLVVRAGKLAFGKQTFEVEDKERLTFTDEALVFSDGNMPYDEIFYRKSDIISLHAKHVELTDRCFFDIDIALTMENLTIGEENFNPEQIKHMEVATDEIVIPREAMGFGDVKFMGAIGAFLGWQATVFSLMISAIIGSAVGVTLMMLRKDEWAGRLPYGPYIALAATIWIFGGHRIWSAWWNMVGPIQQ